MSKAPCQNCAARSIYCHSHCLAYASYSKEVTKERHARNRRKLSMPEYKATAQRLWN